MPTQPQTCYRHRLIVALMSFFPFFSWLRFLFVEMRALPEPSWRGSSAISAWVATFVVWVFVRKWLRVRSAEIRDAGATPREKAGVKVSSYLIHLPLVIETLCAGAALLGPPENLTWACAIASAGSAAAPCIWAVGWNLRNNAW